MPYPSEPVELLAYVLADAARIEALPDDLLPGVDRGQLRRQAQGLVTKRWHEVRALLPRTLALQSADAWPLFRVWAAVHWPAGQRRHAVDALAFLQHIDALGYPISASEGRRLRVMCGEMEIAMGWDAPSSAWHLCWRDREGIARERWLRWGLCYPPRHVSLPHSTGP